MMPRTNGNAVCIQNMSQIVGVNTFYVEADNSAFIFPVPINGEARYLP